MFRLGLKLVVGAASLSSLVACRMENPAFDFRETESVAEGAEASEAEASEAEGQDTKSELGDGDGDTGPETTGDGDPTSSGDGDGEPTTTGDGDGEPTTTGDGDGDPTTTGDGDGEPTTTGDGDGDDGTTTTGDGDGDGDPNIALDMMAIDLCPNIMPNDECQMCAAQHCCFPGAETCFENGSDCKCIVDCINADQGDANQCGESCAADVGKIQLASQFQFCMASNCANFCG